MPSSYGPALPLLLLIESDLHGARSVRTLLEGAPDVLAVVCVSSVEAGLRCLETQSVSAVLLDLSLAESRDDAGAISRIRLASPGIAIMLLAGAGDQALARRAVESGATDYIVTDALDTRSLCQLLAMMFERRGADQQKFVERERAEVTLNSIGDAVVTTDTRGNVTYLNAEAEARTGWTRSEAFARPLSEVFDVTDGLTGQPADDPSKIAIEHNRKMRMPGNFVLVSRLGTETSIEHSAAPIHDHHGAILGAVIIFRDVIVSRERRLQMLHLAEHDALTELPNRLLLSDRLTRSLALARRNNRCLAVLFIDCDQFKSINDTLGHAVGDQVLRSIARRLTGCVRESDTVSRHGGDEFVILLSDVENAEAAWQTAEKIVQSVSEPHQCGDHELQLTVSVGISVYPDDGQDAQTLIMRADAAMYHAKSAGRNQVGFYQPGMAAPELQRSSLEAQLRDALEREQFVLHYQPVINLATGSITGAEALIRWRHPSRGLLPPDQFIPAAEATGLIVPIGRWTLGEACRQARVWQDLGLPPTPIAVNVSALQFRTPGFFEFIQRLLDETPLDARYLELELTETSLMLDSSSTQPLIAMLQERGVALKVDDFGTGPSSLSYLQQCPLDGLKIDQSFVSAIKPLPAGAPLVTAAIAMGKGLGCRVVAEGVETRHQLVFLRKERCDEGQGYHFSPAVDAEAFARLLTAAPFAVPLSA